MSDKAIITPITSTGMGWAAIDQREIDAVTALLRDPESLFRYRGEIPGQCGLFEQEACQKLGVAHALFVNSGTAALSCCLASLGIGPGDEVIVPAYTYIATAAAVVAVGAVPVLCEIDESLGLDPADVEKKITPYTRAVILVHMQGVPGRIQAVREVCRAKDVKLIEDCCQAIGTKYFGKYTGVDSDAFAWSLNYFKVITCGEGGVFFTNDDAAFLRGVYESDPGSPMWDSGLLGDLQLPPHSRSGFRGNEISAAIARVQLEKLEDILAHTRGLKKRLIAKLNPPANYHLQHVDDPEGDNGVSTTLIANTADLARAFSAKLLEQGLSIGSVYNTGFPDRHIYTYWDSILTKTGATPAGYPWADPAYKGNVEYSKQSCPRTLDILARCLRLSFDLGYTQQNIDEIAEAINRVDTALS